MKTIGQRCADWFLLRQFRATGTSAGQQLLLDSSTTEMLGINATEEIEAALEDDCVNPPAVLNKMIASWFSSARSSEVMNRGIANEGCVMSALRGQSFVKVVFECGVLSIQDLDWLACSPDEIALIDTLATGFDAEEAASGAETQANLCMASIDIKTSVAHDAVDRALAL